MTNFVITFDTQKSRDYSWRENLPNYGLRLTSERRETLCDGVTYLQRNYVRTDGKPVQAHIVIASNAAQYILLNTSNPFPKSGTKHRTAII